MRTYACHTWQVEDEDDEVVVDGEEEDVMLVRPWRSWTAVPHQEPP
jgi:hypothetical protein